MKRVLGILLAFAVMIGMNTGSPLRNLCSQLTYSAGRLMTYMTLGAVAGYAGLKSISALPEIINVPGEEFYGEGYDDSDRRIPDISKARKLLDWEPVWSLRDTVEAAMRYQVEQHRKSGAARLAAHH